MKFNFKLIQKTSFGNLASNETTELEATKAVFVIEWGEAGIQKILRTEINLEFLQARDPVFLAGFGLLGRNLLSNPKAGHLYLGHFSMRLN